MNKDGHSDRTLAKWTVFSEGLPGLGSTSYCRIFAAGCGNSHLEKGDLSAKRAGKTAYSALMHSADAAKKAPGRCYACNENLSVGFISEKAGIEFFSSVEKAAEYARDLERA